jgi:hypothetical protein
MKLLDQIREKCRLKHFSMSTFTTVYFFMLIQYCRFLLNYAFTPCNGFRRAEKQSAHSATAIKNRQVTRSSCRKTLSLFQLTVSLYRFIH